VQLSEPDNHHFLLCQILVSGDTSKKGDSGGPVVMAYSSTGLAAVGITQGNMTESGTRYTIVSPMWAILNEMYDASGRYVFDPTIVPVQTAPSSLVAPSYSGAGYLIEPHFTTIVGPGTAGPSMTCHWYSGTDISYTHVEWFVDNVVVGTSTDLYYSASSNFTIAVHYWNENGDSAFGFKDITVSEGTPQCYDE
jgi:hypothetical protein